MFCPINRKNTQLVYGRSNGPINDMLFADFVGAGDSGMLGGIKSYVHTGTESHTDNPHRSGNGNARPDRDPDYSDRSGDPNSLTHQNSAPNS